MEVVMHVAQLLFALMAGSFLTMAMANHDDGKLTRRNHDLGMAVFCLVFYFVGGSLT